MTPSNPNLVKILTIRGNVIQRLQKEFYSYQKEADVQTAKIEKMKAEGADIHDLNKQREVLQETLTMMPDTKRRLDIAIKELEDLLDSSNDLEDPHIANARAILAAVQN